MCDETTANAYESYEKAGGSINRRDFTKLAAAGGLAMAFPQFADAQGVNQRAVSIKTPEGDMDALLAYPKGGAAPGVLMWPDIKGLRPAFESMAVRLASQGYAVVVVNPFYRDLEGLALPKGVSFPSAEAFSILRPMRAKLTPAAVAMDTQAVFDFMDQQPEVSTAKPRAVLGYCMSGTFTMQAAVMYPDKVAAVASFHGGGLATNEPDSPHLSVSKSKAVALHAIAEDDDKKSPEMKPLLVEAYGDAGLDATIKVYEGTSHGWCPPDSKVYNEAQAEAAWAELTDLLSGALKPA
ncbi:dienelactone hydrolase family protein [Halioxenophilus aromaticivorans]|uniref:Dienelactone hydrolase family protein n=1 Tax=Halioxenophilus aromaticivorans TaxID=1306992 RepID=A0AAV3UA44_9ALTE